MRRSFATALILAGLFLPASAVHAQSPLLDVSPEAVVNTVTAGNQADPAVAASTAGTVWIAWNDKGQLPPAIKARRFDASGVPLGPEIVVQGALGFPNSMSAGPRIGATAGGGCVVVWAESPNVWLRRFDPDGTPLGDAQRIAPSGSFETISFPDVAVAGDGSFLVAWLQSDLLTDAIQVLRFDPTGQSVGAFQTVISTFHNTMGLGTLRLAGAADGGFLAVWLNPFQGAVFSRRYDGSGAASPVRQVDGPATGFATGLAATLAGDGSATVAWGGEKIWSRRLDATGAPLGAASQVAARGASNTSVAVGVDGDGNVLVVWSQIDLQLKARLLKPDLTPLSGELPAAGPAFLASDPVLATTAAGDLALAWTSGFQPNSPFLPLPSIAGLDGSGQGVAARIFGPTHCGAGSEILCLGPDHRFEARVSWKNPSTGETGAGHTLPLTADTGSFWFFGDQNLELMVKVLDGTGVNGHFWVYGGSLSNVEYTLTVTDTLTGGQRTYHNPAGQFASFADVTSFPFGVSSVAAAPAKLAVPATADPASLSLGGGQFSVTVDFVDPRSGLSGHGTAVPLTTDTGAFWFFDDSNLELMLKVLDGRTINGKFWVFYGALSDVEYTITVTRVATGEVRIYHNPRGTLASRADTQAF